MPKNVAIHVTLTRQQAIAVAAIAAHRMTSSASIVRFAVSRFLNDLRGIAGDDAEKPHAPV